MAELKELADVQMVEAIKREGSVSDGAMNLHNIAHPSGGEPSWWESIKQNPKAIAWCCYMLYICIMWGYDGLASGIVLALPQFRRDYGYEYQGQYVVSAAWQLAFTGGSMAGAIIGALIAGVASKWMQQRFIIIMCYMVTVGGVFAQYFSPGNLPLFFAGKLLSGLPLGTFITIAPIYCSEVAPKALRGAMVAAVNTSIVIGQLLGFSVMRQTQTLPDKHAYLNMFAVQWGFAVVGLLFAPFLPESPFRLVMLNKAEQARKSIQRLYSNTDADKLLETIKATINAENAQSLRSGSFRDCFKKDHRMRTLVALSIFFFQNSSGVFWVVGYIGYFLQLSGLQGQQVFDLSLLVIGVMAIGSITSWFLIERFGRRPTIVTGYIIATACLLLIGVLSLYNSRGRSFILAQVGFMAIWAFTYQASIGAVGYALVAEIPTTALRAPIESLATVVNGAVGGMWSFALPYMINPDEANMGGKVAFVFFGVLVLACFWAFFNYPETKGRTFEEIDELYRRKISPRHFAKTRLDQPATE